jgi:hypothetical protein
MRSRVFSRGHTWAAGMLLGLGLAATAQAAPFCLENEMIPPQCIYYDTSSCEQDARRQGAYCSVNPQEVTIRPGAGQYCVVTSSQISLCNYYDRGSCTQDASRLHGVCSHAPYRAPSGAPDTLRGQ